MDLTEVSSGQSLYKIYKDGDIETVALRDASLNVAPANSLPSGVCPGAGKSTLLNLVGGLSALSAGKVIIQGVDITRLNEAACLLSGMPRLALSTRPMIYSYFSPPKKM